MFLPALALAGLELAGAFLAPQQIGYGEHRQLPSFQSPADHATLDSNRYGDVVVTFHAGDFNARSVEALVIQAVAPGLWDSQASTHYLLGDASLNVYGAGDDSCTKPAVTALDDDSFVIVWPRQSTGQPGLGRLECARIQVRDPAGALLAAPVLETLAIGEGFIVDPLVPAGDAGLMPDIISLPGAAAVAVYASEDWVGSGSSGETYREYSLRLARMEWSAGGGSGSFVQGPWPIATSIPMDNSWWDPYFGGIILPEMVADDLGNLVVVWEDYLLVGHPGYSGTTHRGRIQVRRLEAMNSALPLRMLDEFTFTSSQQPALHQRRPSLSTTSADAGNDVLLGWLEERGFPDTDRVEVRRLHFPSSMDVGLGYFTDGYWIADLTRDESHATSGMLPGREIVLANRHYWRKRPVIASDSSLGRSLQLRMAVTWSLRPAVRMIALPDGAGGAQDTMFMTYEGANVDDRDLYQVYFVAYRL